MVGCCAVLMWPSKGQRDQLVSASRLCPSATYLNPLHTSDTTTPIIVNAALTLCYCRRDVVAV